MRIESLIAGFLIACAMLAQSGDPERDALDVLKRATELISTDPAASLACASQAAARDSARHRWFWPVMLDAEIKLGDYQRAEQLGDAGVGEIRAGRMFSRVGDVADEAKFRRAYARALEHRGKLDDARLERAIADRLSTQRAAEGPNHQNENSDPARTQASRDLNSRAEAIVEREWAGRVDRAKAELLAQEVRETPPEFRATTLDGREVTLKDFAAKPLVAAFWATWCEPCRPELEALEAAYPRVHEKAQIVAISIDDSPQLLRDFALKSAFPFAILGADRATEVGYTDAHIPQLYVFDGNGNIRFHLAGFDDDGLAARRIEWMIEASK